jgi:peptide/nickel transport system substrate-binding protein
MSLAGYNWDEKNGMVNDYPVLAKEWKWNMDSTSVLITLRDDVQWSDGTRFTAEDVVYSFDLYSDPKVQSRFFGILKNFYLKPDLSIDLEKSFNIINPYSLRINFTPKSNPTTYDFCLPIMPKHIFEKIDRSELSTSDISFKAIGTGPFKVSLWQKNQYLKLELNKKSFLYDEAQINDLVFKIIPDYHARINQLKKGEIDLMEYIRPEDMADLTQSDKIKITARKGREYDYLGLNNVTPFANNKSHFLFGSPEIRKAITLAINRELIVKDFLMINGSVMITPIAPIFKKSINDSLKPLPFDPKEAKQILTNEGWRDSDADGILEKGNKKFSFVLSVPSGNSLRQYASTIIQNNLKAVGIDVKIETLEPNILFEKIFKKELDAWIAGWSIPIPLDLKPYWHSNPEIAQANVSTYSNKRIDIILNKLDSRLSESERIKLLKEFQKIIFKDQPAVFLFWIDNLVGYNKKIKNIVVDPLATIQKCWKWEIE